MGFLPLSAISAGIFMAILMMSIVTHVQGVAKSHNLTRLKIHIANVSSSIRIILMTSTSYTCTGVGGPANCTVNGITAPTAGGLPAMEAIHRLLGPVDPVLCGAATGGPTCSLFIKEGPELGLDSVTNRPYARIVIAYDGTDFNLAPIEIKVEPPPTALQPRTGGCSEGIYLGLNPDGTANCKVLGKVRAAPGSYISSADRNGFNPTFSTVPTLVTDCAGPDQFISGYSWKGGSTYSIACGTRVSPSMLENL